MNRGQPTSGGGDELVRAHAEKARIVGDERCRVAVDLQRYGKRDDPPHIGDRERDCRRPSYDEAAQLRLQRDNYVALRSGTVDLGDSPMDLRRTPEIMTSSS